MTMMHVAHKNLNNLQATLKMIVLVVWYTLKGNYSIVILIKNVSIYAHSTQYQIQNANNMLITSTEEGIIGKI